MIQTSDIQLFRLQLLLPLLFEELLSENEKREEGGIVGERSCAHLHHLTSKNLRSWRLVGWGKFHQTHANPSTLHRNNRLDVICFLPCSQGRDGERLGVAWGMEKGLGGVGRAPLQGTE